MSTLRGVAGTMVTVSSSVVDRSTVASAVLLCAANQSVDNDSDTATLCHADRLRWIDDTSRLAQLVKDVVLGLVLVAACLPGEEPARGMDGWMDG